MHEGQQLTKRKPVIAVLGGAGPDATIDIQIKLFKTMKEKLNIFSDQDHYRVIVDNNIDLPNRDIAILNGSQNLLQMYIHNTKFLEKMGANVLIIPCNSAHVYFRDIQRSTSMVMINMVEQSAEYIAQHFQKINQVGLLSTLSTIKSKLYHQALEKYGIEVIVPNDPYQRKITQAIYGIKAGFVEEGFLSNNYLKNKLTHVYQNALALTDFSNTLWPVVDKRSPKQLLQDVIAHLIDKGVKLIILGCTELPLVENIDIFNPEIQLIDPTLILAQSTIQTCINLQKQ